MKGEKEWGGDQMIVEGKLRKTKIKGRNSLKEEEECRKRKTTDTKWSENSEWRKRTKRSRDQTEEG